MSSALVPAQMILHALIGTLKRNKMHVDWTRAQQLEKLPKKGDAVRIIDPDHKCFGATPLRLCLLCLCESLSSCVPSCSVCMYGCVFMFVLIEVVLLMLPGFTGMAIKLELSYGRPRLAVRLDRTQRIEFLELSTPPTSTEPGRVTMIRIDKLELPQILKVGPKWREQVCGCGSAVASFLSHLCFLKCDCCTRLLCDFRICVRRVCRWRSGL